MKICKKRTFAAVAATFCLVLLILPGCVSIKSADHSDALEIIELINSGNSASLSALSSDTFLLDGEILQSRTLIDGLWEGLTAAGFRIDNPAVSESRQVMPGDYKLFADSPETEIFFMKNVPEEAVLFRLSAGSEGYLLIIGPAEVGENSIIAFGGPY